MTPLQPVLLICLKAACLAPNASVVRKLPTGMEEAHNRLA